MQEATAHSDADDKDLLESLRNPATAEKAFRKMMSLWSPRLYWPIRRVVKTHHDTHDVLQNTFVKVWKNLDQFKGESQLFSWAYRIALNESINYVNYESRRQAQSIDEGVSHEISRAMIADDFTDGDMIKAKLVKAIDALPTRQKQVFEMRYYDEMPYEQMAEVLQLTVGALKASFHHAVKKIEEYVTNSQ